MSDVDLHDVDGHFVEFVGKSSTSSATAAGGAAGSDRWTAFEYTPVHMSYR